MLTDKGQPTTCQGCGALATAPLQCPLCEAEGASDRSFFCSQECFARNWLEHRNTLHKGGVVRERKQPATTAVAGTKTTDATDGKLKKGKKRAREAADAGDVGKDVAAVSTASVFPPWPSLPSASTCVEHNWAVISPALPLDVPRAVIRPQVAAADQTAKRGMSANNAKEAHKSYFWSALLAAAQYTMASVRANPSLQVLVVAGDVYSAHAFAWAARCVGLTGLLQLAVADAPSSFLPLYSPKKKTSGDGDKAAQRPPFAYFTSRKRVVIATAAVVREAAAQGVKSTTAVSGAASLWLTGKPNDTRLITLPDVVDPADLQGVQTRAVFFTGPQGTGEEDDSEDDERNAYTYSNLAAQYEDGTPLLWTPVTSPAPGTSATPVGNPDSGKEATKQNNEDEYVVVEDARQLSAQHAPSTRLDNEISTCFANGDLAGALHLLVRFYNHNPGNFESALFYLLCCNWGAANLAHAHHRLAYIARFFCDRSTRLEGKKNATLGDAALRAVTAVVRLLPRMRDSIAETAAVAAHSTAAGDNNGGKSKSKKLQKTESSFAGATATNAVAAASLSPFAAPMPTLATTTRPTPFVEGVSTPTALEVARLANYYTYLPNLQLQATVCCLYNVASSAVLDTLARAWGLHRYLPGTACLAEVEKARSAAVLRVRQRYTTKLDDLNANFYVVLMELVYDAVGPYSLSVEEVRRRLLWDLTLAHDAGSLEMYLQCCALLPNADGMMLPTARKQKIKKAAIEATPTTTATSERTTAGANTVNSLSSRQTQVGKRETQQSRTAALRCFDVKVIAPAAKSYGFIELPWKNFPITGERQRQIDRLHTMAVEEVLMAMPRVPRPMYIGDVGNLVGKWARFNARFDGVLGATLQVFLEAHPEAFRVVDRLVTRRAVGATEQVRIRYDGEDENGNNDNDNSDDEDGNSRSRKNHDRQMLTGRKGMNGKQSIELPARARKKRAVKEFNKERFNRNYKSIDASARVPGYVKRGPRRIKGRGKKANKRVVKRGS